MYDNPADITFSGRALESLDLPLPYARVCTSQTTGCTAYMRGDFLTAATAPCPLASARRRQSAAASVLPKECIRSVLTV